jgi:hypothetical protein
MGGIAPYNATYPSCKPAGHKPRQKGYRNAQRDEHESAIPLPLFAFEMMMLRGALPADVDTNGGSERSKARWYRNKEQCRSGGRGCPEGSGRKPN